MELSLRDVSKAYGAQPALTGVSLTAGEGVLALLGPNGSGKTTLLRILATVLRPDAGTVCFAGRPYAGDLRPLRRRLGYLPQQLEPPGHLTPRTWLRYLATLKAVPAEPRASQLLADLGLAAVSDRPLGQLSGGERRRVGLAQALLGDPVLLVLDEPTAGLDPEERERALRLIARPAPGRVVMLSSHLPAEVEAVARQVVVLRRGAVCFAGEVAALRRRAAGRVWETAVPAAAVAEELQRRLVSRVTPAGDLALLRVVGDPPPGARPAAPTLEDAYLLLLQGDAPAGGAPSGP